MLISLAGGAVGTAGQRGAAARAERVAAHSPISHASCLSIRTRMFIWSRCCWLWPADSFLARCRCGRFCAPIPYEVVKAGSAGIIAGSTGRRITLRDVLLVVQIAICAVLVTSSLVAVRGLVRRCTATSGLNRGTPCWSDTDLSMAGYSGDSVPAMQRRMIEALETIPGVKSVGLVESNPAGRGRVDRGCLYRPNDGSATSECRSRRQRVQHLSRLLPCGGHSAVGRQGFHLA